MNDISVGKHDVTVIGHRLGRAKTGAEYVAVTFEDAAGNRSEWYGFLTDSAMPWTLKALGVLGWRPEEHAHEMSSLHGTHLLRGAKARIQVVEEEYEGRVRRKVKWVSAPGGDAEDLTPAQAKGISSTLRAKVAALSRTAPASSPASAATKTSRSVTPPPATASVKKPGVAPGDDAAFNADIPF